MLLLLHRAEQLSVHEARQEEEADSGGREPSSALEQRGGELLLYQAVTVQSLDPGHLVTLINLILISCLLKIP